MFLQLALLIYFLCGAEGLLSISPSGTAEVEENSRLTLISSYTGAGSPTLVYWLKNGNPQFIIWASSCIFFGGKELDPAIYEKTCTNGGKDFTLTFIEVSTTQDGEKWSCRVNTSPQIDSAEVTIKIKVPTTTATTTRSKSSIGATVAGNYPGPNSAV